MNRNGRVSLREQGYLRGKKYRNKKEKSGFFIRFNICMTIVAAVILLSKVDLDVTNRLTSGIRSVISSQTDTESLRRRAADIYADFIGQEKTKDVFSEIDEDIAEQIKEHNEQEESLKNR